MTGGEWTGAAVAAAVAAYALGSRRLAGTPVSTAMVFAAFGLLIGPAGLGLPLPGPDSGLLLPLLETALALVLFTDAMAIRRRTLRRGRFLPGRLLGIGLPLTIGAGWLLAWPLFPELGVWELALVGAVLAPTDAALGRTTVSSPRVPALVRQGLTVESGLNDGMVLPFFVLFLAAAPATAGAEDGVAQVFWRALVLSTALGMVIGWTGGRLLKWSGARGWVTPEWGQALPLALAAGSYFLADSTGGSGFIAVWMAGFAFGAALRSATGPEGSGDAAALAEDLGGLLAALSFLVFGAVLLGPTLERLEWRTVCYALLSLTVVRMVPVALSLLGSGLRAPTVAFVGWFGPRGLASVILGLLAVRDGGPGLERLGSVMAVTVFLSIVLHGVSAAALSERLGRWYGEASAGAGAPLREEMDTGPAGDEWLGARHRWLGPFARQDRGGPDRGGPPAR